MKKEKNCHKPDRSEKKRTVLVITADSQNKWVIRSNKGDQETVRMLYAISIPFLSKLDGQL
jgi:hypothetical protein